MNPEKVIRWLSVVATVATVASATYCMTRYGTTIWWGSAILFLMFATTYGVSIFWMRRDAYESGVIHQRIITPTSESLMEVQREARAFVGSIKEGEPISEEAAAAFVRLRTKLDAVEPFESDPDEMAQLIPEPEIRIAPEIIRHPREDVL